jgi:hypothetical protein
MREGNEAADWRRRTDLEDFEIRATQRPEDKGEHGGDASMPTSNSYRGHIGGGGRFNTDTAEKEICCYDGYDSFS